MGTSGSGSRKLVRILPKKKLGGVCAGFAYWLGWPTWVVRAAWVVLTLSVGTGLVAYIVLWIFMPATNELPPDYDERTS